MFSSREVRTKKLKRDRDFVTPPSSESSSSYEKESTDYDSIEETVSYSHSGTDSSDELSMIEDENMDIISVGYTEKNLISYDTITSFVKLRGIFLNQISDYPMGTNVRKKEAPFGENDQLYEKTFRIHDRIIKTDNSILFIILLEDCSRKRYCISPPFFLDWVKC